MANKVLSFLQMVRKDMIKPGGLVKCVETVKVSIMVTRTKGAGKKTINNAFVQGRPYRVLHADPRKGLVLKGESGVPIIVHTPIRGVKPMVRWTSFGPVTS